MKTGKNQPGDVIINEGAAFLIHWNYQRTADPPVHSAEPAVVPDANALNSETVITSE